MKNQRGSAVAAILGGVVVLVLLLIVWGVVASNAFMRIENGISAANETRQTTLSNISQKVKEAIGIRGLSVDDIKATVNEQIHARNDGKNPMVVMLQENNVAPSPELYTKIINIIDSGRSEFLNAEKMMIDRKRVACDKQRTFPNSVFLSFFGLPKLHTGCAGDTDDFKVLVNSNAGESFRTGEDKGLY